MSTTRIAEASTKSNFEQKTFGVVRLITTSSRIMFVAAALLLVYGLVQTYSTRRYLKGFADAIVPLQGSPQQKTEALLAWFRNTPSRSNSPVTGESSLRDPVNIVQNKKLLKVCGSASNAFLNLADVTGLHTRRLLLLDSSGGTMHVVTEVRWDDRWVVVDPQHGQIFANDAGQALTKEQLRDPEVFRDAISRMPGYSPGYTFEHTAHLHPQRIPVVGGLLERGLDGLFPEWQEAVDWGYVPENPSLWPILLSLPLFLLALLLRLAANRYVRPREEMKTASFHETVQA